MADNIPSMLAQTDPSSYESSFIKKEPHDG